MQHFLTDFVTLLVVLNPIGKLPVYLAVTSSLDAGRRRAVALRATLVSFGVLVFFIVTGQILLEAMDIGLNSFRLAGSLVLLLFALQTVFGALGKPPAEHGGQEVSDAELAVFPLAIPAIAGPGTILAVVVLTDNDRFSIAEQLQTTATLALALVCSWLEMRLAEPLLRLIRPAGASIAGRVMGLILASLAVDGMVRAIMDIARRAMA